ncbi:hypothetical protein TNCV_140761 [Trichonephila clavipes]|nr:hypothetical protein TNCV_140761 [Trichonephila clavipes]
MKLRKKYLMVSWGVCVGHHRYPSSSLPTFTLPGLSKTSVLCKFFHETESTIGMRIKEFLLWELAILGCVDITTELDCGPKGLEISENVSVKSQKANQDFEANE